LKVGFSRKESMKALQGEGPPFGAGAKVADMLSRMLGRGLADTVVLVLELDGVDEPTAMENVAVKEPLAEDLEDADVFEGAEDVVDSGSVVARFCTPRL